MTCLYEVTLHVDAGLIDEYDAWLRGHVADMLTLPGFLDASILAIEPDATTPPRVGRVVHYRLENRAAFDAYLREHAARMRAEGSARFGDRCSASRRILLPLSAAAPQ